MMSQSRHFRNYESELDKPPLSLSFETQMNFRIGQVLFSEASREVLA
jgi:hypothetical protein